MTAPNRILRIDATDLEDIDILEDGIAPVITTMSADSGPTEPPAPSPAPPDTTKG